MIGTNHNIHSWKSDQIKYFKEYLGTFSKGSKEYKLILDGIKRLEKTR